MKHAIALSALLIAGCATNGLQTQARAAIVTRQTLATFQDHASKQRLAEQRAAIDALRNAARAEGRSKPYQEDARAAVEKVRGKWEPLMVTYNAVAEAYRTWVDWLVVYVERDEIDEDKLTDLMKDVMRLWRSLKQAAKVFGIPLPALPWEIESIVNPD